MEAIGGGGVRWRLVVVWGSEVEASRGVGEGGGSYWWWWGVRWRVVVVGE